jgi:hypothetical protein
MLTEDNQSYNIIMASLNFSQRINIHYTYDFN